MVPAITFACSCFAQARQHEHLLTEMREANERLLIAGLREHEARAELAEVDRQKDRFLAMLAHELRNPLAPILNAVALLQSRGSADPLLQRQRQIIERQAKHLRRLVEDLLDVARVNQGKLELREEPLVLGAVVERALEVCSTSIESHGHHVTLRLAPEPLQVYGDPARLEQVLSNLLNNAAKYTDPGGQITLSVTRDDSEAVIRISDTGRGIAPEMLPRIFDLFTQAEQSLARTEGGLGIGLTMVRTLVEMHGGSVEVSSQGPGRGSTFTVRLPVLAGSAEQKVTAPAPVGGEAPEGTTIRRVLVVEDNVDAAQTLAELLELWNWQVQVVHDGCQALVAAERCSPNVILLDIGLPGLDGYEVARRLRQESTLDEVVLVALTGYGDEEALQTAREAGFDHYLVKPVDPADLQRLLLCSTRTQSA